MLHATPQPLKSKPAPFDHPDWIFELKYDVAFGTGADFKVLEVWDSEEHARNFGQRLMPILKEHKIELSREPKPQPVKNTIQGKSPKSRGEGA